MLAAVYFVGRMPGSCFIAFRPRTGSGVKRHESARAYASARMGLEANMQARNEILAEGNRPTGEQALRKPSLPEEYDPRDRDGQKRTPPLASHKRCDEQIPCVHTIEVRTRL